MGILANLAQGCYEGLQEDTPSQAVFACRVSIRRSSPPAYNSLDHSTQEVKAWLLMALFHCMVRHGTVHFWGGFHWVLYLVPDTFLVPLRSRFQASRTVTKTWRVNSADHWLAGENRHYCVTELATRDPPLQSYPLVLFQAYVSVSHCGIRPFCVFLEALLHYASPNWLADVTLCLGVASPPSV